MSMTRELEHLFAGPAVDTATLASALSISATDGNKQDKIKRRAAKLGFEVINLGQNAWVLK